MRCLLPDDFDETLGALCPDAALELAAMAGLLLPTSSLEEIHELHLWH